MKKEVRNEPKPKRLFPSRSPGGRIDGLREGLGEWAKPVSPSEPMNMGNTPMNMTLMNRTSPPVPKGETGRPFLPVAMPDLGKLPFTFENGAKVFHLIAEPVGRLISRAR